MVGAKNYVITERLKQMIEKYASAPDTFLLNGGLNEEWLDALIAERIDIVPGKRSGSACIAGTRIAVCDIVEDTRELSTPVGFQSEYGNPLPQEAVDAAYAYFIKNPEKVRADFEGCFGRPLPRDLYV